MTDPIAQAAAALAGNPALAERQSRALVARDPGDPRTRLILASALRRLGRTAEALPLLNDLAKGWPRAARTRYELGLCLCSTKRHAEGQAQLDEAVRLDPNLAEAWQAIADGAFASGDTVRERRAQAALARLAASNPELGKAAELVALHRHEAAEPLLRRYLASRPQDTEALRLLAVCYVIANALDDAEALLRHALRLQPAFAMARFDLAHALFAHQKAAVALEELAPLLAADPANPAYRNLQAGCLALLGDDAGAEAIHAGLAAAFPGNARVAVNHGHALRTTGRRDDAIAAYRRALALQPTLGEAWWSIANLKLATLTADDEAAIHALLARPDLSADDRLHLHYALGKRLEDDRAHDRAFAQYAAGAALRRASFTHDANAIDAAAAHDRALFTAPFLTARAGMGALSDAPIFVVGLPRSGSTLIEQILASHPRVEGTMELPYMGAIAARLERDGTDIAALSASDLAALGNAYLAAVAPHRRLGRPRFIDKMPNNFRYIGLIRLILPQARIIDVRRHPMAAGFSGFKQLFATGQEFSYDLSDIARHYRRYLATIRHYRTAAPGAVHTVVYEDVVNDTEQHIRRLLDACNLPFDPACLRFFENDRAVRTVSSEQVRQPIYRSGLDQWQAFATHLEPLANALGPDLVDWRA